jgi:hypothetical protein
MVIMMHPATLVSQAVDPQGTNPGQLWPARWPAWRRAHSLSYTFPSSPQTRPVVEHGAQASPPQQSAEQRSDVLLQ